MFHGLALGGPRLLIYSIGYGPFNHGNMPAIKHKRTRHELLLRRDCRRHVEKFKQQHLLPYDICPHIRKSIGLKLPKIVDQVVGRTEVGEWDTGEPSTAFEMKFRTRFIKVKKIIIIQTNHILYLIIFWLAT